MQIDCLEVNFVSNFPFKITIENLALIVVFIIIIIVVVFWNIFYFVILLHFTKISKTQFIFHEKADLRELVFLLLRERRPMH